MPRILVVDDDPEFLALCRAVDGESEFSFAFAQNDEVALALMAGASIPGEPPLDIVAVTIDSPAISGMGLFKKLQGIKLRVPRIAITGLAEMTRVRHAIRDGAADFLVKPVSTDDLVTTLAKVFEDCEARRKAWRNEAQLSAIRREIDVAGDLQRRIIPKDFPQHDDFAIAACIHPAKHMSGDFYDVIDLEDDRLGVIVADVAGKGIPAAFYMAVARTILRTTAATGEAPSLVLEKANRILCHHDIPDMFVSVFYGILDTKSWRFTYGNAGHLPPYFIDADGGVTALEGGEGVVLGVIDGPAYEQDSIILAPGDGLFLYTDGVTEAFDIHRNQFSDDRLIAWLSEHRHLTAEAMARDVFAHIGSFTGGAEQSDDITSLVIKRR